MRITVEVRNGGVTESGLSLVDRDGNRYHWITRRYSSPLFYLLDNEWLKVRLTVLEDGWGIKFARNVRVVK
ncbi:hypothetical protein Goe5_c02440 [Bacillus phage vB_BthM-Goe5]|nr:hypothetical protein Goe5_c02440 [Bacillus phage vB_BthM-Goe5]